jgi:hypothetical protein
MKISDRVQRLKTELSKQTATGGKVNVEKIKDPRLKELAKDVAGGRNVTVNSFACVTEWRPNETVSKSRLESAISKIAAEAKKADTNKDGDLKKSEQLKLSERASEALGYQFSKEDTVITSC